MGPVCHATVALAKTKQESEGGRVLSNKIVKPECAEYPAKGAYESNEKGVEMPIQLLRPKDMGVRQAEVLHRIRRSATRKGYGLADFVCNYYQTNDVGPSPNFLSCRADA